MPEAQGGYEGCGNSQDGPRGITSERLTHLSPAHSAVLEVSMKLIVRDVLLMESHSAAY